MDSFVTAHDYHAHLVKAFRIERRCRLEIVETLLGFSESRLYRDMGYSSIAQYAEAQFRVKQSSTFEYLRVARRLRELPRLRTALGSGEFPWSVIAEVTKVATEGTEEDWLDFAAKNGWQKTKEEVAEAREAGRDRPRKGGGSGPSRIATDLSFELFPEERELTVRALDKHAAELARILGVARVSRKESLLSIMNSVLETEPEDPESTGALRGRKPASDPAYTVVYHRCSECRRSGVVTADGPKEVPAEVVERVAGNAEQVTLKEEENAAEKETPNAAPRDDRSARRRTLLRDGGRCRNPGCRRKASHAHHFIFKRDGGPDIEWNRVSLCLLCRIRHKRHYAESRIMPSCCRPTRCFKALRKRRAA